MRKRAMGSAQASIVKMAGHRNERDFADLIGGSYNPSHNQGKHDVVDAQGRRHSVKAGTWWQVFLYGRERLSTNTELEKIGNLTELMVACLDAFPENFAEYVGNKKAAKCRLQKPMQELLAEMEKPEIFKKFLTMALFNGDDAEYLSMYIGQAKNEKTRKIFHVFHKEDVVNAIVSDITLRNSKARNRTQMDDQKIILYSSRLSKNIGEIEDRHDSEKHYKQMKFRLNAKSVFDILTKNIKHQEQVKAMPQIYTYGCAVGMFNK